LGDRVDVNTFANSQCAIRDYMRFKLENEYMHEARVLVSSMGKTRYNDILKVVPRIETNNSSIDIIGDTQFERDYYGKYTNEYQIFTFIMCMLKGGFKPLPLHSAYNNSFRLLCQEFDNLFKNLI